MKKNTKAYKQLEANAQTLISELRKINKTGKSYEELGFRFQKMFNAYEQARVATVKKTA